MVVAITYVELFKNIALLMTYVTFVLVAISWWGVTKSKILDLFAGISALLVATIYSIFFILGYHNLIAYLTMLICMIIGGIKISEFFKNKDIE